MTVRLLELVSGAVTVMLMFDMIRRRNIKEKYAVLWVLVGLAIIALAAFPKLLDLLSDTLGVRSGPNLLLFVAVLVLTLVCVQLSVEVSRLEDRSRALAEEFGLLRLQVDRAIPPYAKVDPGPERRQAGG